MDLNFPHQSSYYLYYVHLYCARMSTTMSNLNTVDGRKCPSNYIPLFDTNWIIYPCPKHNKGYLNQH